MCNICGKRFALQCNLRAHVKLHMEFKGLEDGSISADGAIPVNRHGFQNSTFSDPCSVLHPERSYNNFLHVGFASLFPFSQKFVIEFNDNNKLY